MSIGESKFIHMNGRAYDYNLGRFLSVDPFIQAPGNSQSMNPYSYIMNNPLSGTDPSGYTAECESDAAVSCKKNQDEDEEDNQNKRKRNRARDGLQSNLGKHKYTGTFVTDNGTEVKTTITTKRKVKTDDIGSIKLKDISSITTTTDGVTSRVGISVSGSTNKRVELEYATNSSNPNHIPYSETFPEAVETNVMVNELLKETANIYNAHRQLKQGSENHPIGGAIRYDCLIYDFFCSWELQVKPINSTVAYFRSPSTAKNDTDDWKILVVYQGKNDHKSYSDLPNYRKMARSKGITVFHHLEGRGIMEYRADGKCIKHTGNGGCS